MAGITDGTASAWTPGHRSDPVAAVLGAPETDVKVLLAHQPSSAFAAQQAGFDLQLSGHTHGGQYFPFNYVVRLFQPFVHGPSSVGSGLGLAIDRAIARAHGGDVGVDPQPVDRPGTTIWIRIPG